MPIVMDDELTGKHYSVAASKRVSVTLREWETCGPSTPVCGERLLGLELRADVGLRKVLDSLHRAGALTVTELRSGLQIETGSYVGRIVVGPLDVTILPKISWDRWLALFGYALGLRNVQWTERAPMRLAKTSLRDLILHELVTEARSVARRGLHRDYVRHVRPLASPRGRIDFRKLSARGGVPDATIPCRFTRRSDDSTLNRLLLAGVDFAARFADDASLRWAARRLVMDLEGRIDRTPLSRRLVFKGGEALDRRTQRYEPIVRLAELIVDGDAITLQDDQASSSIRATGFALDMNALWQRLLARVLTEWNHDFAIRSEFQLRGLFERDPEYSPASRRVPTPRPDYAAFQNGKLVAFLDAKYRDLWSTSLPREMLYQLALYAIAQRGGVAAMLYPTEAPEASEERIEIRDPADGRRRGVVALRPVNINVLEALITAPTGEDRSRRRERFARELIGE